MDKITKNIHVTRTKNWVLTHKLASLIILVIAVPGAIFGYRYWFAGSGELRYVVTEARLGNIQSSVSGTGYVSSENQIDIKSKVSGDITNINVRAGDKVALGQIIARVDSRDALIALETQRIAYAKLIKSAKPEDIKAAEYNLTKAYSDAWNAVSDTYLDLSDIMSGLKTLIYGNTGYLNEASLRSLGASNIEYRQLAGLSYDEANRLYEKSLSQYKSLNRTSSRADIENLLEKTYEMIRQTADALKNTRNALNYISERNSNYDTAGLASASTLVNTWSSSVNSTISSILSAENSVITNDNTLNNLKTGADSLDIQSAALSLQEKQNAYDDYFIRAPYDGIIAKVDVNVGSSASGAIIATIVSNKKFADIPLNEIDAASVKPGNRVRVSFDAAPELVVDGLVEEADLVGTVSQGVVTYNIRVMFEADDRVRAGMSASAEIVTNEKSGVIVIPASAVKSKRNIRYVDIFNPPLSGTKEELQAGVPSTILPIQNNVEVGIFNDTQIEITSGLNAGDQVVIRTIATSTPITSSAPTLFGGGGGQSGNIRLNR